MVATTQSVSKKMTGINYPVKDDYFIHEISQLNDSLVKKYQQVMAINPFLNRKIVSFQANKNVPFYRWYKYKEGFSVNLVNYYINKQKNARKVLDPFAGSGAALFAASDLGIDSVGIELLPIGQELINTRNLLVNTISDEERQRIIFWKAHKPWIAHDGQVDFIELKITRLAYSDENSLLIKKYLSRMKQEHEKIQHILLFALCCILENISFTRKDGQYLRWDQRSGRCCGAIPFNKGEIDHFNDAIVEKLHEILEDTAKTKSSTGSAGSLFDFSEKSSDKGNIQIIPGSCLIELPKIPEKTIDLVITSPPYCNRYDYTRTYALELAMLGVDEAKLLALRQEMLSCTVENREKNLLAINSAWSFPLRIARDHELLQKIIEYLEFKKKEKTLNNNGLPRMVKGYFYEMSCVIYELYRVLNNGGQVIMVNDNVRYAGASIPVDVILSNIAESVGFTVEQIAVLPVGKGNSSQQMGEHGREALRKCVYIWRKN